jgi:hypothetical protein
LAEPPVLRGEEAAGAAEAGLDVVDDEQGARRAAQLLRLLEITVRGQVHALALDRLDQEGGHLAAIELPLERIEVTEPHRVAARQQRLEAVAKLLVPVHGQRAEREAVEAVVAVDDARPAACGTRQLYRGLDGLGARARQHDAVERRRRPCDQLLSQQARESGDAELGQVGGVRREHARELLLHVWVAAPEREDPVAGKEVEVLVALAVGQVGAVPGHPLTVEAERAQDAAELWVEVALVERHRVRRAEFEQIGDVRGMRIV